MNALRWEESNTSPESGKKILAHELFHLYQEEFSGFSLGSEDHEVPEAGPRWTTEGTAEYLAYRAMDAGGVLDYQTERNSTVVRHGVDKPLSEMETLAGYRTARGNIYAYFLLAAELLASSTGQSSLIHYYMLQQPGTTWQEAFKIAFAMPVEEFYELFEEHRAAGFPGVDIPS